MTELHPQGVNAAANKRKQGELVVPVVASALLVRVRLGPCLRTLETCNMQILGGRKNIFKPGTYENWQQQDIPTCMFWQKQFDPSV